MRNTLTLAAAGLLVAATAARAQQAPQTDVFVPTAAQVAAPQGIRGWADFGLQFTDVSGDKYRLERYRDFSDGFLLQGFQITRQGEGWTFDASATHLGRRDRRMAGEFRRGTTVRASFSWDQIPLYVSGDTRTLYSTEPGGVLRLDDGLQGGIQAGRLALRDAVGGSVPFAVTSERRVAAFEFAYLPTRELSVNLKVKQTDRQGSFPYGASFGFSDAVEVAAPLDTRTTDVSGDVQWASTRGMVRIGYAGSTFDNRIPVLVWDNPLKLTDSTASNNYSNGLGGSQGRAAMFPSNTMHGVTAAGSAKLPANSRVNANLTFGSWRQNEPLLPVTINSAVPPAALPRQTTEGDARTVAMNYTFSSQPSPYLYLNARFRSYSFDNRTPIFDVPISVVFDQTVHEGAETEPLGYTRQNVDLDASFTPVPLTAFRVGYSRNVDDRTFRIFERTTENVARASVDSSAGGLITVRAALEHGRRRASGFDEEVLLAAGENPAMRHYDVADRDRNRLTALVQVMPSKALGLSVAMSIGKDDYLNTGLGLRDNDNRGYTLTADIATKSRFAGGVSYTQERYTAEQRSRYVATPGSAQVDDPTRDWFTDTGDKVRTINVSFDVRPLVSRVDLSMTYDASRSRATYVYRLPSNTTLAPVVQLPALLNDLQTGTADLRVHLSRRLALGLLYWYDSYDVEDFSAGESTLDRLDPTGSLFLGNVFRPYDASSAAVRLICSW